MQLTIEALDVQVENKGKVQFPPTLSPMRAVSNLQGSESSKKQFTAHEKALNQIAASSTFSPKCVTTLLNKPFVRKVDPFSRSQSVNITTSAASSEAQGFRFGK